MDNTSTGCKRLSGRGRGDCSAPVIRKRHAYSSSRPSNMTPGHRRRRSRPWLWRGRGQCRCAATPEARTGSGQSQMPQARGWQCICAMAC
eukprot:scaffold130112_cov60-Phaeocystis_antarctica.AAC.2